MSLKIGYAGLGAMGTHIVPHIAKYASGNSLPPLTLWNRSSSKYAEVKDACPGATFASDPSELVDCDLIFTSLANDKVVEEVYGQMMDALKKKGGKVIFADQSTILPGSSKKTKEMVESAGGIYLTCPVFGQPMAAKAAQLICISSGPAKGRETVKPILGAIGKHTIDVGEDNSKGAALKLIGNGVLLSVIQAYAETYALCDAIDFDPKVFHELHQNLFGAPVLLNYSNKMSQGRFGGPGFTVTNGFKDASHIQDLGKEFGHDVHLNTIARAENSLVKIRDMGLQDYDWSSIAAVERMNVALYPIRH